MDLEHSVEEKIKELDEFIITNPDVREFKRALAVKLALQGWRYEATAKRSLRDRHYKNRQTYYGALDLFNSKLYVEEYKTGNGEKTVDFLKRLIKKHPETRIIIFWDGAPYHRGQEMQEFLSEINQNLEPKKWKITCELFAPYAPEENPIEAIWLSLKNLLRRAYRFGKNFTIIKRLFKLLIKLKLFKFPNLGKYDTFSCLI